MATEDLKIGVHIRRSAEATGAVKRLLCKHGDRRSNDQHTYEKLGRVSCAWNLTRGGQQRQVDPWGFLASQHSIIGEHWVAGRNFASKI